MRVLIRLFAISMLVCAGSVSAEPAEILWLQTPAVIGEKVVIPPAVTKECSAIDAKITDYLISRKVKKFTLAPTSDANNAMNDKVLKLTLLDVNATGGGGWSGPKLVTIRADMLQEGKILKSWVKTGSSKGGVLGAVKGTSSILDTAIEDAVSDVAVWLENGGEASFKTPTSSGDKTLYFVTSIAVDPSVNIPAAVTTECPIQNAIVAKTTESLTKKIPTVQLINNASEAAPGKNVLSLIITAVDATPAGPITGAKLVSIRMTLSRDGQTIQSLDHTEKAGRGSVFGQVFRGTCSLLNAIADDHGQEIADWTFKNL